MRSPPPPPLAEEIGEALAAAVEEAASALWGSDYLGSLSLRPRPQQAERRRGPHRQERIARLGARHHRLTAPGPPVPRALGYLLHAAAEILDATDEHPCAEMAVLARQGLEDAIALVERARNMKRLPAGTR